MKNTYIPVILIKIWTEMFIFRRTTKMLPVFTGIRTIPWDSEIRKLFLYFLKRKRKSTYVLSFFWDKLFSYFPCQLQDLSECPVRTRLKSGTTALQRNGWYTHPISPLHPSADCTGLRRTAATGFEVMTSSSSMFCRQVVIWEVRINRMFIFHTASALS